MADGYTLRIVADRIPQTIEALLDAARQYEQATAEAIVADAQAAAPVRTGALRDSIMVVSDPRGRGAGHVSAGVYAPYAPFVEFGTRYMSAEPFFYPALEKHWQTFLDAWNGLEAFLKTSRV